MTEFSDKPLSQISYCYLGLCCNSMGDSLLIGGSKLGTTCACAPRSTSADETEDEYAGARRSRARG